MAKLAQSDATRDRFLAFGEAEGAGETLLYCVEAPVAAGKPSVRIQIMRTGTWDFPDYGRVEITPKDIKSAAANFNDGVRGQDLPVNIEHRRELGAVGWYKSVTPSADGQALYADIDMTTEGQKLLAEGRFKYFSPELLRNAVDPETKARHGTLVVGGALTNYPRLKRMAPILAASEAIAVDLAAVALANPVDFADLASLHVDGAAPKAPAKGKGKKAAAKPVVLEFEDDEVASPSAAPADDEGEQPTGTDDVVDAADPPKGGVPAPAKVAGDAADEGADDNDGDEAAADEGADDDEADEGDDDEADEGDDDEADDDAAAGPGAGKAKRDDDEEGGNAAVTETGESDKRPTALAERRVHRAASRPQQGGTGMTPEEQARLERLAQFEQEFGELNPQTYSERLATLAAEKEASDIALAEARGRVTELEMSNDLMVMSEKVEPLILAGKIPPAEKNEVSQRLVNMGEDDAAWVLTLLDRSPALVQMGEVGSEAEPEVVNDENGRADLNQRALQMSEAEGITYKAALNKVSKERATSRAK